MALMRAYIDQRSFAGQAGGATNTFAHGLPGTPHHAFVRFLASLTNGSAAATSDWWAGFAVFNSAGVTISNPGNVAGPNLEVTTILFHSIIQ